MRIIKERSKSGPQFIITTHSPFIVNNLPLENIFFCWQEKGESKIERISKQEDLGKVFFQIGIQPSDILFPDIILLVEGESDRIFFSGLLNEIKKDQASTPEIQVIPCFSADKEPGHYEYWSEITQFIPLPKFAILDKNKMDIKDKLKLKGLKEENILVLSKGDLEDYYPRELIKEFLLQNNCEVENVPESDTVKFLKEKLGEREWWKKYLAEFVIRKVKLAEIDEEIEEFLKKIVESLREKSIELAPRGNWKKGR
jgi:hypothetical protein